MPFGAAAASAPIASVTYLQEALAGQRRVPGLAVFHVALRVGMSVAAIGGGLLAQVLAPVRLPLVGGLRPAALVLFGAGLAMIAGAILMPAGCTVANSRSRWPPDSFRSQGRSPESQGGEVALYGPLRRDRRAGLADQT